MSCSGCVLCSKDERRFDRERSRRLLAEDVRRAFQESHVIWGPFLGTWRLGLGVLGEIVVGQDQTTSRRNIIMLGRTFSGAQGRAGAGLSPARPPGRPLLAMSLEP